MAKFHIKSPTTGRDYLYEKQSLVFKLDRWAHFEALRLKLSMEKGRNITKPMFIQYLMDCFDHEKFQERIAQGL